MKKKVLSYLIVLLLLVGLFPASASATFNDIYDPNTALAAAVLESMGIVNGVAENTYRPNSRLTRAEFCTLAVRAMGLEDQVAPQSYKALFTDVRPGSWYTGYVNLAYSKGIINGYGNGRFGPEDSVTYGQAATILLRLLGYTSKEIGVVWPADYANYANKLELQKGLWLNADTLITRGQAAILLYNTLGTEMNGGGRDFYQTISGIASSKEVIILNNNASNSGSSGLLMVCSAGTTGSSIEYHTQKIEASDNLVGYKGKLLFDSAGKTAGFIPSGNEFKDVTVSSAKSAGITAASGVTYNIPSGAQVIYNGSLYTYGGGGYIQVDTQKGRNVRLFYDDNGAVTYIYISSGSASGGTGAIVAETNNAASELARKLGISTSVYSISKNGAAASANDLSRYDTAYYDAATRTMCVSDYKITGYIEAAVPNIGSAKTLTIAGCKLDVLESAWDTLKNHSLGSRVTVLLTDDNKVAAAYPTSTLSAEMMGILSVDGSSVKLSGSGLVLTAGTISVSNTLRGDLVTVSASSKTQLTCYPYTANSNTFQVDIANSKIGSYKLAPGCAIYEWTGDTSTRGYVYSLSGALGESSSNFSEITWTDTLSSWNVSYYRLNSAGQVDILLLKDVTGNSYDYGKIQVYTGESGINLGSPSWPAYNNAANITNGINPGGSTKYLWTKYVSGAYAGISLAPHSSGYPIVASVSNLTPVPNVGSQAFFRHGEKWHTVAGAYEIPVSSNVQVYIKDVERWYAGEEGLSTALSSGMPMTLYYDRLPSTGAQIRVIVVQGQL